MMRRKPTMEDLDRDIREHIAIETQDNIERGTPPQEARYAALRKFEFGMLRKFARLCGGGHSYAGIGHFRNQMLHGSVPLFPGGGTVGAPVPPSRESTGTRAA